MKKTNYFKNAYSTTVGKIFAEKKQRRKVFIGLTVLFLVVSIVAGIFMLQSAFTAGNEQWNLNGFVTGISVKDADGKVITDKNGLTGSFNYGDKYTFTLSFAESDMSAQTQFAYDKNGHLVYQFPSQFDNFTPVSGAPIKVSNGNVVGWYNLDANGHIEVWFGDFLNNGTANPGTNFIDNYSDASFVLEIDATFKQGAQNGKIDFGSDAKIDAVFKLPPPSIRVDKSSAYNSTTERIDYTIVITALGTAGAVPPQEIKVTSLTDMPWLGTNTSVALASTGAYSDFRYKVNNDTWNNVNPFPTWVSGSNGNNRTRFTYTFPNGGIILNPGGTVTVNFSLDIKTLVSGNTSATGGNQMQYNFIAGNHVSVVSDAGTKTDTAENNVIKSGTVSKSASYNSGTEKITYTVSVKAPADSAMTVSSFRDAPWIGSSSTKLSTTSNSAFSAFQYCIGSSGTYTPFTPTWNTTNRWFDQTFTPVITVPAGQTLYFTYVLDIQELLKQNPSYGNSMTYDFNVGNTATITTNLGSGSSGTQNTVKKTNPVSKNATYNRNTEKIDYTVTFTVPSGSAAVTVNTFKDTPNISGVTLSGTSGSAFINFKYKNGNGTLTSFTPAWNATNRCFEHTFTPGLVVNPGQTLTFTYTLDLQELIKQNPKLGSSLSYNFNVGNSVTLGTDKGDASANGPNNNVGPLPFLTKTGSYSEFENKINWTITVGSEGNTKEALNGKVVTDILGSNMTLPANVSDITITLYRTPTGTNSTFRDSDRISRTTPARTSFTANEFGAAFSKTNNNNFTFTVPTAADTVVGGTGAYSSIYRVVITFSTTVPPRSSHQINTDYKNEAKYGSISDQDTITVTPLPPDLPPSTAKNSSGIKQDPANGKYYIDYKIDYHVPAGYYNTPMYFRDIFWYENTSVGGRAEYTNIMINLDPKKLANLSVTVSPAPTGNFGDTVFEYFIGNNGKVIYLFAGKFTSVDQRDQAVWPYLGAKTLTLSYRIYLADFMMESPAGMTVEEYLKNNPSNVLFNQASSRQNHLPFGNVSDTDDAWPVHKSVKKPGENDTVYDYTVFLNYNQLVSLFASGTAEYIDSFDSSLEYVPKSFYIKDNQATARYYGPYVRSGGTASSRIDSAFISESGAITVRNDGFTVRLNELAQLTWNTSGLAASTLRSGTGALQTTDWYTENRRYEIHYQLRLKDPSSANGTFKNTAEIKTKDGETFNSDSDVKFICKPKMDKNMDFAAANGSNIISVDIVINPYGMDIIPLDIETPRDRYTAVDTMSGELSFYLSSIKLFTQTKNPDGSWNGVWKEQAISNTPGSLWSISPISAKNVEFIFPNNTPVMIRYDALVTVEPGKTAYNLKNEISVCGQVAVYEKDYYKVDETKAVAIAEKQPFTVRKRDNKDPSNVKYLQGAVFELYMANRFNTDFGSPDPSKKITAAGKDFYYVQTKTTDINGMAVFDSNYLTASSKAVYLLVETAAPPGYTLPAAPDNYAFFVIYSPTPAERTANLAALEAWLLKNVPTYSDFVFIENEMKTCNLEISKVVEDTGDKGVFNFIVKNSAGEPVNLTGCTITVTSGTGTYNAVDLTKGSFTLTRDTTILIKGLAPGTYQITEDALDYSITYKINGGAVSTAEKDTASANTGIIAENETAKVLFTNVRNLGVIYPDTGGPGDWLTYIGAFILLSVSMFFGGALIYRNYKRRRSLDNLE